MRDADTTMQPHAESSSNNSTNNDSTPPQQINATRRREDNSPSSYTVLIVDDEPDTTFTYKSVLEGAGFNVDVFNDPLEALSKLKEKYHYPSSSNSSDVSSSTKAKRTALGFRFHKAGSFKMIIIRHHS